MTGLNTLQLKVNDYDKQFAATNDVVRKVEKGSFDGVLQVKKGLKDLETFVSAMSDEHDLMVHQFQGGAFTVANSSIMTEELQRIKDRLQVCEHAMGGLKRDAPNDSLASSIISLRADLK